MANEPLTDRQLEVLAKEVALALSHGPLAPIATIMQSVATADVAYLIDEYKRLRDALALHVRGLQKCADDNDRLEAVNAAMRPIVERVATPRRKTVCGLCAYPYASNHGKERRHTADCPSC